MARDITWKEGDMEDGCRKCKKFTAHKEFVCDGCEMTEEFCECGDKD